MADEISGDVGGRRAPCETYTQARLFGCVALTTGTSDWSVSVGLYQPHSAHPTHILTAADDRPISIRAREGIMLALRSKVSGDPRLPYEGNFTVL